MVKKLLAVVAGAVLLSGCSVKVPATVPGVSTGTGSVWKSYDGGETFVPKVTIDEEKKITTADVVSFVVDPTDSQTIYMGTLGSGLFKTTDGAEHWEQITFPPIKTYGLAIDATNSKRLFVSGVFETIAKIYRTEDGGENWKEIYTEPGKGTVITSLVSHPSVPSTLYAGTSAGVIIKSTDSGETWINVAGVKSPVTHIVLEKDSVNTLSILVLNKGVITSTNGGESFNTSGSLPGGSNAYVPPSQNGIVTAAATKPSNIISLADDPSLTGVIYVGAQNGLFKSTDGGTNWENLPIIDSAKNFPIRAIAINPHNSQEIVFASGNAFYKSIDGGTHWATTQLEINRGVSLIRYSPQEAGVFYFALRKF